MNSNTFAYRRESYFGKCIHSIAPDTAVNYKSAYKTREDQHRYSETLGPFYRFALTEIGARIGNYNHKLLQDKITHPWFNFKGSLAKPPLNWAWKFNYILQVCMDVIIYASHISRWWVSWSLLVIEDDKTSDRIINQSATLKGNYFIFWHMYFLTFSWSEWMISQ